MEVPSSDDPGNSGLARYDQDKLNQMAAERAAAGFQLGFHAIGDRANSMALNAFGVADQVASLPPSPPEHGPMHDPDAHIITKPESGPPPRPTDMKGATDRLSPERVKSAYAWKTFLDHNVPLAFGPDSPVELINPFRGLYSAITRQNEAGTQTFQPQEKISLNEAIYAYTQASAYGEFREKVKGRLEPGYLAALIVLDPDITTASPQELLHTKFLRTVVNPHTVYTP